MTNLTDSQQAAAFHGLATNQAMPISERLACALQALDWYEADRERTQPVVEAAEAWRAKFHTLPQDASFPATDRALIVAIDQAEAGTNG